MRNGQITPSLLNFIVVVMILITMMMMLLLLLLMMMYGNITDTDNADRSVELVTRPSGSGLFTAVVQAVLSFTNNTHARALIM